MPGITLSFLGLMRGHHAAVACPVNIDPKVGGRWEVHYGRIRDPWRVRIICRIRGYYFLPENTKRMYRPINLLLFLCLSGNQREEATSSLASLTCDQNTLNEEGIVIRGVARVPRCQFVS
jgi:hypothetical protein